MIKFNKLVFQWFKQNMEKNNLSGPFIHENILNLILILIYTNIRQNQMNLSDAQDHDFSIRRWQLTQNNDNNCHTWSFGAPSNQIYARG